MFFSHGLFHFFPTKKGAAHPSSTTPTPSTHQRQEARPSSFLNSSNRRPMPATATSNNSSKSSGAPRETPEDSVKNGSVRWVDLMPQKFDNKDQEEQGSQGIPVFPGWLSKAYVHKPKKLNWNSKSAHDIS